MPTPKDLRVIQGGKAADAVSADEPVPAEIAELLKRVGRYRRLLASDPKEETAGLVNDMEEAIKALRRLENSSHPEAPGRATEYRRLIAEIDAEIVAALKGV